MAQVNFINQFSFFLVVYNDEEYHINGGKITGKIN